MMGETVLILAIAAIVGGVGVLRMSWSRARRAASLNTSGWTLIAVAAVLAGAHSGAWGISVAALFGMGAALLWLAYAATAAPAAAGGRASNRRVGMLPEGREPLGLGRRLVTFVIAVPAAMLVSAGLAIPARRIALLAGAQEADANVIGLFAMPLCWAVLVHVLLIKESRAGQYRVLATGATIAAIGVAAELIR
jgi:hypothetical protein